MTAVAMNNYSKQIKNARRPQAKKQPRAVSVGEALLARQLDAMKIPYIKEFQFHPERKWRADFRIDGYPILVECEGGIWSQGRHTRGKGFEGDCEKYNQAAILGYHVLKGSTQQVKSGRLLRDIENLIKALDQKVA